MNFKKLAKQRYTHTHIHALLSTQFVSELAYVHSYGIDKTEQKTNRWCTCVSMRVSLFPTHTAQRKLYMCVDVCVFCQLSFVHMLHVANFPTSHPVQVISHLLPLCAADMIPM